MMLPPDLTDALYTARWHLLAGQPVPGGGPREALLEVLGEHLGSLPVADERAVLEEKPIRLVGQSWLVPPDQSFPIVGRPLRMGEFPLYLSGIDDEAMTWSPNVVVIHHTAAPSLAQRPVGWQTQHMLNLRKWYLGLGWKKGPHLFTDEDEVWAFSPLTHPGTHAVSYNRSGIGIEMLGDFDSEDVNAGRGRDVLHTTIRAAGDLLDRFALPDSAIVFHRDDPKTRKTCPGRKVDKARFLKAVAQYRREREFLW